MTEAAIRFVGESWAEYLWEEFEARYMKYIAKYVKRDRDRGEVYPSSENMFRAYKLTPIDEVKVVIIGQDPYYTPGVANGLAFSASPRTDKPNVNYIPPSLKNIFKEIEDDLGFTVYQDPDLTRWAEQGVLLLNSSLTVRKNQAGSHSNIGWQNFTGKTLEVLSDLRKDIVFMFWGNHGKAVSRHVNPFSVNNHMLWAAHPSPYSASGGFFGCKHFSKANKILEARGIETINWR